MSVPNLLRWAGEWDNTRKYSYGDTVQSPITFLPYADIVVNGTISGGADPSVNTSQWIEVPNGSGFITAVTAGTGLSGGGSQGNVTLTNVGLLGLTAGTNVTIQPTDPQYPTINADVVVVAAGNDTNIQYNAGNGAFGGSDEFVYDGTNVIVGAQTGLWLKGTLEDGYGGGSGSSGQVLTSTETGVAWVFPVEPPTYTAGTGIDIDVNNVISNLGVLSVSAGTGGVTVGGTASNPTISIPDAPVVLAGTGISVSAGPNYTVTNTNPTPVTLSAGSGITVGTAPDYTVSADPSTLVLSDYVTITGALALTGTFASMTSVTLTTTQASAPICIWGNFNVLDGGSGSTVEARLFCGTTTPTQTGPTITTTVTNAHNQTIPLIFKGIGPTVAGNVTWQLQARVTSGSASRASAQIMVLGQMQNA